MSYRHTIVENCKFHYTEFILILKQAAKLLPMMLSRLCTTLCLGYGILLESKVSEVKPVRKIFLRGFAK